MARYPDFNSEPKQHGARRIGKGEKTNMNTFIRKVGVVAALTLGLTVSHIAPAAAQFSPLRAWGAGGDGQLGNGQAYNSNSEPDIVNITPTVKQFAVSGQNALAVKSDGSVWAWGNNGSGQIGDPTLYSSATPMQVPNFGNVRQVAAGGGVSLALKNDGFVWAWGSNYYGDLGHGGFDNSKHPTPTIVNSLYNIKEISANGHEMALDIYGNVYCWGFNLFGELGTGDTTNYAYPGQVFSISNVRHIAAGEYHSLALKEDGTVWAWGHNDVGQLGDNTTTDRHQPVQVVGLNNVVAIAASRDFSIALKSDGSVWYWGFLYGISGSSNRGVARQLTELGYNNIKISAGYAHILTVDGDGYVWGIGSNDYGQIGDRKAGSYAYPARKLDNLYNVTAIATSRNFTMVQTQAASFVGSVRLEGLAPNAVKQYITLAFNAPAMPTVTRYATVTDDPYVQVQDIPRGYYTVSIKGNLWLQKNVSVDLYNADSGSFDVTLTAGDGNSDNVVDIGDFGLLVNSYGGDSKIAKSGYDYHADFNCDGIVDIADFGLLVNNYGKQGDF